MDVIDDEDEDPFVDSDSAATGKPSPEDSVTGSAMSLPASGNLAA